jgi:16S rRNA (guanine527-N7)-methyltransferase
LEIEVTDARLSAFMTYLAVLKEWNRKFNLTGIKKDEDIIIKHFLDSLLYLRFLPGGNIHVADIGTGAGFPGIPLTIIRPDLKLHLIESSIKKCLFLGQLLKLLHMKHVTVLEKRAEQMVVGRDVLPVDVVVTRAVFSLKEFVKNASCLVKSGGILIHSKGPKVYEEIKEIPALRHEIIPSRLPLTKIKRNIVVIHV